MGTKVDLERLELTLHDYTYAYLMTTAHNGAPHAVAVGTDLQNGQLHVDGFGWRTQENAREQPIVALVYPPTVEGGYSLIVDGEAVVADTGLVVSPTVAVLHRPPRTDGPPPGSGCASDCQRIETD